MKQEKRKSVVDTILDQVKQKITDGELVPGEKIPTEMELCELLGVGRNSLREAMKILSALGVVEIRQGDGTYLRKNPELTTMDSIVYTMILKQSNVEQMIELREKLESDLLELAVKKATENDIHELKSILNEHKLYLDNKEYEKITTIDIAFHDKIANVANNPIMKRMAENVYNLFGSSIADTLKNQKQYEKAYEYHTEMVQAIERKNMMVVNSIVERSLKEWKKQII